MKVTRVAIAVGLSLSAVAALALPTWTKDFCELNKVAKGSNIEKANCAICHVGKTLKLNLYGQDIKKEFAASKSKKITPALLKKLADIDSDKDGAKNGDEIKADTLPGDEKSVPAKN